MIEDYLLNLLFLLIGSYYLKKTKFLLVVKMMMQQI